LNVPEPDTEQKTVVIGDDGVDIHGENLLESLPLKPQERYKFIRSIGFGGMKGVLLVHDRDTGRDVAMAIMPDFRDRPQRDLDRFVREAMITARLEHPNIVPVYDNCLPEKSCGAGVSPATSPCDLFSQIQFPTGQFFPEPCEEETTATAAAATGSCGCKK